MFKSTRILLILALPLSIQACSQLKPYPYGNYETLNSLSNADSLTQELLDTDISPHGNVCHLQTYRKKYFIFDRGATSSAALIEGRYLITAAHNVFDYPTSQLRSIEVSCGVSNASAQTVQKTISYSSLERKVKVPKYEWRWFNTSKKFKFDYAFIDLGEVITPHTYFSLGTNTNLTKGTTAYLAGYPGRNIGDGHTMKGSSNNLNEINDDFISYGIRTATGNSGGPVWIKNGDNFELIGIHIKPSMARRIDENFINEFNNWKEQLK